MPVTGGAAAQRRRGWQARAPRAARAVSAGLIATLAFGVMGCTAQAAAAAPIRVASAYVPVPQAGTTVAYVVIRNNGAADRLVSARSSAGGRVVFRAPAGPGPTGMHTVPAITVPAHATLAMVPDGYHMLITGSGPMRGGKDITLTLVFAHVGPVPVVVTVTNPATGGSSYFLN
jgi:copper(I)-binding protein